MNNNERQCLVFYTIWHNEDLSCLQICIVAGPKKICFNDSGTTSACIDFRSIFIFRRLLLSKARTKASSTPKARTNHKMCETFIFYHICGHVLSGKTIKCSAKILKQLELQSDFDEVVPRNITPVKGILPIRTCSPSSSSSTESPADCGEVTKSYLAPTLCKQCEQNDLICKSLHAEPGLRYNIIRQWTAMNKENASDTNSITL